MSSKEESVRPVSYNDVQTKQGEPILWNGTGREIMLQVVLTIMWVPDFCQLDAVTSGE